MRLGIISDIHANLPALEAVLEAAADCDALVCCGDLVGYYANPNEVCDRIREKGIPTVRGNHDAFVIGELTPDLSRDEVYRSEWTRQTLSHENLNWIHSLPVELRFAWRDIQLTVRHASPWDETTYLYADSECLSEVVLQPSEILAVGHSHRPFLVDLNRGKVLNPGSVGQPRGEFTLPSYAVLDVESRLITHRSASYDADSYRALLASRNWSERAIEMLRGN